MFRGITVAVKELISSDNTTVEKYDDFYREIRIMSMLTHPNVVRLFGACVSPLAMVMEFVPEGDLFHFMHPNSQDPHDKCTMSSLLQFYFAIDIAKGLCYLHSMKPPIIHRDLRYCSF